MGDFAAHDAPITALSTCLAHKRTGICISFAAAALFLFEYFLTFGSELRHIWVPRRVTLTSVTFTLARYTCLLATALVLKPSLQSDSASLNNVTSICRFVAIVASELILAARTWAIWERRRSIGYFLGGLAIVHAIPCIVIIAMDVIASKVVDLDIPPELAQRGFRCSTINSPLAFAYIVPYILAVTFESTNLSLSLYKIVKWRQQLPSNRRMPFIDNLRRDGILYYCWLLSLSIMNIGFVVQRDSPQLRQGGAQLQAALHSVLSTRIVLHMASSKDMFTTPMSTTVMTNRDSTLEPQFTSFMMTRELMTDIGQDAHFPDPREQEGIPLQTISRNTHPLNK